MNIHIPNMPIKAAFFAHLILYIWAAQCSWIPVSYLFYNSIFLITILWTIHLRDSEEGPFMAVCINLISILLDIALFIMNWPSAGGWESHSRFGAVCGVANLLLRPVSSIILYRLFLDRAGTYGNFVMPSGIDSLFSSGRRAPYEDIDQTVAPPQEMDSPTRRRRNSAPQTPFSPLRHLRSQRLGTPHTRLEYREALKDTSIQ